MDYFGSPPLNSILRRQILSSTECIMLTSVHDSGHYAWKNNTTPVLWNSLPLYIREAPTLSCFKGLLKAHFFIQHYDMVSYRSWVFIEPVTANCLSIFTMYFCDAFINEAVLVFYCVSSHFIYTCRSIYIYICFYSHFSASMFVVNFLFCFTVL